MTIDDHLDACLHKLFEEQARRAPQAPAVVDPRSSLTYEELDRQADLLAAYLRNLGIGPDEVVGVYMERSAAYVVACLAALCLPNKDGYFVCVCFFESL